MWGKSGEAGFGGLRETCRAMSFVWGAGVAQEVCWEGGSPGQGTSLFLVAEKIRAQRVSTGPELC